MKKTSYIILIVLLPFMAFAQEYELVNLNTWSAESVSKEGHTMGSMTDPNTPNAQAYIWINDTLKAIPRIICSFQKQVYHPFAQHSGSIRLFFVRECAFARSCFCLVLKTTIP